ncbi:MAG: ABC transporter ATP-binding protein [Desulfobacteraceae bacterium]|nr:ABC transporter ATP-binding protein [Desulfobacteraceae bacterium]MBC2751562.1 ABC transporter ATP-binding protein [Desulfobacteraceae bacterium]
MKPGPGASPAGHQLTLPGNGLNVVGRQQPLSALIRTVDERPGKNRILNPLRLIKPSLIENRTRIIIGLISLIIVDFLQLIIPRIIKTAVDDLTLYQASWEGLLRQALLILIVGLCIGVFRYIWRRCLLGTSRRVEEALRNRLFGHLQRLSARFFDTAATGDLMAHATNDINQVRMATGMGMVALNDAIVLGAAAIGFMLYINVQLTLLVLIPAPLIVFGTRFFSRQMHKRYQTVQKSFADLTEVVRERLAGIRVIKAYTWQAASADAVESASRGYVRENLSLVRVTGAFMPMMVLLTNLSMVIVLGIGGRQTILQEITPGEFVAFISYLGLLTWPMMAMGWVTNLIQRGKASLQRLNTILTTQPHIEDRPNATTRISPPCTLAFQGVSFHYRAGDRATPASPVLQDIELTVEPGQTLGIVGPPGAGKTTLLNLIPRLYDPTAGRVLLNGTDLRDIRLNDLRGLMASVPQEPFLFAGTIRENITLGRPVDQNRLDTVLAQAALTRTMAAFPRGLDTLVGEKGVVLSGGQKQRIALARALLMEVPLMLLDDPISQVDMATGHRLIDTLQGLQGVRALLIATHRLSAIRRADQIIVLQRGRIVAAGTHDDLVDKGGYYAETAQMQAVTEALDAA